MNIVICIDDNFLMQACTFITSLIYTNKENINLFVISEKLSDLSKKKLIILFQEQIYLLILFL